MKTVYVALTMFIFAQAALPGFAKNSVDQSPAGTVSTLFPSRISQQKVGDCAFQSNKPVVDQGISMSAAPGGEVTISGKDQSNHVWTSTYEATPGAGCQLWKVDLGQNGRLALAFIEFSADSSGGWDTTLSLLLFDDEGRPFPWQATSLFTVDDLGVRELVKLGEEKQPAIIVPRRLEQVSDTGVVRKTGTEFHAYSFTKDRVREVLGYYANRTWPLIVPAGFVPSSPSGNVESLSTASVIDSRQVQLQAATHEYVRLNGKNDSERQVEFTDQSMALPKILVVDRADGRSIISLPQQSDFENLKALNLKTTILGQDCDQSSCSPLIMWMK
jgi:hypothetical protein